MAAAGIIAIEAPARAATSRVHQNNNSAPAPVDKTKEKDATQLEPPSNNVANSGRQQLSGPPPSSPPETSTRPTSAAPGNDDQPAFSPSR